MMLLTCRICPADSPHKFQVPDDIVGRSLMKVHRDVHFARGEKEVGSGSIGPVDRLQGQEGPRQATLNGHNVVEYHDSPLRSIRWKCEGCNRTAEILDEYMVVSCK